MACPGEVVLPWNYHFDTSYLIEYLRHREADTSRQAREVVNRLQNIGYGIRISQVAVGELLEMMVRKPELRDLTEGFFSFITSKKDVTVYRLKREDLGRFTALVNHIKGKIKGEERKIDGTDVQIVACSMVDRECRGLFTFDDKLITSKAIKDVIFDHVRNRKRYSITDGSQMIRGY